MNFLNIEDLHINLGEFYLKGISFSLEKGDYLNIIGPTGAGKTILLESIIGFWKPDKGKIFVEGEDITHELPEHRRMGIVYQDYALLPHFTVFKNIAYGLKKIDKINLKENVKAIAASLHIDHLLHRKPDTLSGGEQQRVALARALAVKPRLLLMDEPFSALDPQTRKEARKLLRKAIDERETTVIHITHDLDDVWALANKVAIFRDGLLLQLGSTGQVFNRPNSRFVADFVGAGILHGKVKARKKELTIIDAGSFELASLDNAESGTEVRVAIRPEDIIVSTKRPDNVSAQNVIETVLQEVINGGTVCTLILKAGDKLLNVLVTNSALENLKIKPGDTAYAIIKASSIRIS